MMDIILLKLNMFVKPWMKVEVINEMIVDKVQHW